MCFTCKKKKKVLGCDVVLSSRGQCLSVGQFSFHSDGFTAVLHDVRLNYSRIRVERKNNKKHMLPFGRMLTFIDKLCLE